MKHTKEKKVYLIEIAVLIGFVLAVILADLVGFTAQCESVSDDVLRLHILANSDSDEDQQLKLQVRDRILVETGTLFEQECDLDQAIADVNSHLDEIEAIAQDQVYQEGYDYPVKAELANMFFETRTYGDVTLPAGRYNALRITIGEAQGHNWWCVLYPPLCVPAAEPEQELEESLTQEEIDVVTSDPTYDVRFAVVEVWEKLKESVNPS